VVRHAHCRNTSLIQVLTSSAKFYSPFRELTAK
jgi:hypothetical protein